MWLVNLKNLHACANMIVVLSFFIINTNYDNKFHMIFWLINRIFMFLTVFYVTSIVVHICNEKNGYMSYTCSSAFDMIKQ